MRNGLLILSLAILLLAACTDDIQTYHYEHIQPEGWARTDTLRFTLAPAPQQGQYAISAGMRYTPNFPYEGIWIVAETHLHHPSSLLCDTLYFAMSDSIGNPIGHGIGLLQHEVPLGKIPLQKGQSGTIRLRHIMSREVIPDITDVGISEKLKVKGER